MPVKLHDPSSAVAVVPIGRIPAQHCAHGIFEENVLSAPPQCSKGPPWERMSGWCRPDYSTRARSPRHNNALR